MKQATDFISNFEVVNEQLNTAMADLINGPKEAKVMFMEILLLKQFGHMDKDQSSTDAVNDMKALVTRLSIFISSNDLRLCESDVHPGLWKAARQIGQGSA